MRLCVEFRVDLSDSCMSLHMIVIVVPEDRGRS